MSTTTITSRRIETLRDGWVFVPSDASTSSWPELVELGEPVAVPHTWNALDGQDGGNDYRRGPSTYAVRLDLDPIMGERWLELRGANSSAEVHLDGVLLGAHHGGYSTFRVHLPADVTGEAVLTVVVDNTPNDHVYPQRADFTFYGGIYRDVHLVTVSEAHFALDDHGGPGLTVTPTLDGTRAVVHLDARVTGGTAVRFHIEGIGSVTAAIIDSSATAEITIEDVRRWHGRRDPHLYVVRAELLVDDEPVDEVTLRFGCRDFAVDPELGLLLNGEPYALRGVSRHQDWEGVGNAITREMMEHDLQLIREVGATSVRLAHYQHDQYFYDLCDEAGIVVWAEIPQITDFLRNGTQNATDQLVELIVQNHHHASIVCWGLSNEITVTGNGAHVVDAHREMHELAHRLDPTRPTAMAHLFMLETDDPLVTVPDVFAYNLYFGWYVGELADNDRWLDDFRATHPSVAIGLSEYGADANHRLQTSTPTRGDYTEQFQAAYHDHMIDMIETRPWLWCTYVWNLADFGADARDEGGLQGRNQKGLVSFDRAVKKDAFYAYKAAWSADPFVHVAGRRYVDRAEEVTDVTVYSNQTEVSLWCDDVLVDTVAGQRVFRFRVPLVQEHRLTARSGDLSDSITVRRVETVNPEYALAVAPISNWFDSVAIDRPEGRYSIHDTMADIKSSPEGRVVIDEFMKRAAASRGDVGQDVEIPASMQEIVDRMTVATLLTYAGSATTPEDVTTLNAALNAIPK
ncbi:MAG: glycoside hydrolase family 2 protein [Actinomycetes bacterium]